MATVKLKTNIGDAVKESFQQITVALSNMMDKKVFLLPMVNEMIVKMKIRIHSEGKAADGTQIGTYSPGYMKVRTGDFASAVRYERGKHKGEVKNPGLISRGIHKGEARPKYNRTNDTKIIVSLTSKLEGDWRVVDTPEGYGIGFGTDLSYNKARWVEEIKDKIIFSLTDDELQFANDFIEKMVSDAFKK